MTKTSEPWWGAICTRIVPVRRSILSGTSAGVLAVGPFAGHQLIISCHILIKDQRGEYRVEYCFSLRKGDDVQPLDTDDWPDELARVDPMSACHAVVKYQGQPVDVYCDPDGDTLRRKYNAGLFAGVKNTGKSSDDRS
ncbi:hypothetical protein OB947_07350 [Aeromonas bestiarum]|uniref:hypothetical protein n=1 Tax=Aeromonas bestiarum TaxID=105751 RepID=UPI00259FD861|nr:hypothetical protein [Aeromonas bestiarum]MDM5088736.1 hypothetical protein [Aeromonas bestiarum]